MSPMLTGGAFLSVPGSRPDRFDRAAGGGAIGVILDLEDAVATTAKESARDAVVEWIERADAAGPAIVVRVNAVGSPWFDADIRAIAGVAGPPRVVMVPKVESADDIRAAHDLIVNAPRESETSIMALIESARGLRELDRIAVSSPLVVGLGVGFADLAADLHRAPRPETTVWRPIRDRVLVAARAAGIAALDGPHLGTAVDDVFRADVAEAAMLGFDSKWVIHPTQVATVDEEFAPSAESIDQARRIVDALDEAVSRGSGVATVDGLMIDEAVAVGARLLLASVRTKKIAHD